MGMSKEGGRWADSALIKDQMEKIKHRLRRKASFGKDRGGRENLEYPKKHHGLGKPQLSDPEDFQADPTGQFYHALGRDSKRKPLSTEQKIKTVLKFHNATPLLNRLERRAENKFTEVLAKLPERKSKYAYLPRDPKESSEIRKKLFKRLFELANKREKPIPKLPHKISISLFNEDAIKDFLFTNPKEESPSTRFMGGLFSKQGEKLKRLARFVTGEKTESLEVFFNSTYLHREKHFKPIFIRLTDEEQFDRCSMTNQEALRLFHKTKEIPVAQVQNKEGKILFEVSFSQGGWHFTEETTPDKLNGSWFGNINFYFSHGKINKNQIIEKISRI
jgi:hypothetical protein